MSCARCQAAFGANGRAGNEAPETDFGLDSPLSPDLPPNLPPNLDVWQLDDDLHAARHRIDLLGPGGTAPPAPPHSQDWSRPAAKPKPKRPRQRSSLLAWGALSLGTMALVFGGVLLGWSFVTERTDLWRLGMPFVLGGQAALVVGLVFQLDGLWRSNRNATDALDELDEQLAELRHATSLLATTHTAPSQSFYAHLAERAAPQVLLADLKSQLDLLATQLAERTD